LVFSDIRCVLLCASDALSVGRHVFKLFPPTKFESVSSPFKTTLHAFGMGNWDGDIPLAGLIFDSAGALYGTGSPGGEFGYGVVFELKP
jgi:hypothetical protein